MLASLELGYLYGVEYGWVSNDVVRDNYLVHDTSRNFWKQMVAIPLYDEHEGI